jgi:hypothetical protein
MGAEPFGFLARGMTCMTKRRISPENARYFFSSDSAYQDADRYTAQRGDGHRLAPGFSIVVVVIRKFDFLFDKKCEALQFWTARILFLSLVVCPDSFEGCVAKNG